ncbi:MAG: hypothetical protein IT461_13820 [Planctomycetes bacterium]|nr:hypothetical protein [Planctomycetota bacterium]
MRRSPEIKKFLSLCLSEVMDEKMKQLGFVRRKTSLEYHRQLPDVVLTLSMHFDARPHWDSAETFLKPQVGIEHPKINELRARIEVGTINEHRDEYLRGTFVTSLRDLVPFEEAVDWYVTTDEDYRKALVWYLSKFEQHVNPALERLSRPEEIIEQYEKRTWFKGYLDTNTVVASYIYLGMPEKALQAMERRFGNSEERKLYAAGFEFVANIAKAR